MSTTNPLAQIRLQVQAELRARVPDARWIECYDGEDWDKEDFAQIRARVARQGSGIYVRLPAVVQEQPELPVLDTGTVALHLLCCAGAVAGRILAAEAAEALAWDSYKGLREAGPAPYWMHSRWIAPEFLTVHQSANCTLISVALQADADFSLLDEGEGPYDPADPDPPDTGVATIADTDRVTVWVAALGFARRFITGANLKALISALGIPAGGAEGQVLAKASADDRDAEWIDAAGDLDGGFAATVYAPGQTIDGGTA